MDPERQPLLHPVRNVARNSGFRPLTYEEVQRARHEITWRRAKFFLALMFWATMAMFLSIIVCILVTTPKCSQFDANLGKSLSVPPVHMTFAPLISLGRSLNEDPMYTI
ncbi:uncharacterized protein ACR2FA_010782 [Aphomia sociella]